MEYINLRGSVMKIYNSLQVSNKSDPKIVNILTQTGAGLVATLVNLQQHGL
ncbi:unnamed protein product [Tenebrio molitor]|nr:unnamed protein product [Tenebrio molitor]